MLQRTLLSALACLATLALSGCFTTMGLLDRERLWDPKWFGRYETQRQFFVVLPDDPAKHTYLMGSFEEDRTEVGVSHVTIYRGWDDVLIVGSLDPVKGEGRAVYTLFRPLGSDKFISQWPDCSEEFAKAHNLARDNGVCTFTSLGELRTALKAYADDKTSRHDNSQDTQPLEHRRDHPLSTIGIMAEPTTLNDGDGPHGGLKLVDVPPSSPAAKAGLKKGDQIFGVGDARPVVGEELLLRIAAAQPGSTLVVSFFDGKTHAKRQVNVATAALE